jgi:Leucine-rich repeat (LRR) protein
MIWNLINLNEWINDGCDNNIALEITKLDLSLNNLTSIPIEIGNLINLKKLSINHNRIKTIPIEICNLINLQYLSISHNKLKTIPIEIGNLINLEYLKLNNNELKKIPIKLYNLTNLQLLDLHNNKLKKIHTELGNLINLLYLHLDRNNLMTIPAEIGNLINLKSLLLQNNNLITIPNEIGNLIKLSILFLDNNNLTTLPITITNLILYEFFYNDNPIEYIPPQVVRYLNRNKTTQQIYNDNQSVHNHSIQEGIKKSINYIMSIKPIYELDNLNDIIINNTFINNKTKTILFEYINCQDVHSILNITFAELLINVLSFIDQHKFKNEIYEVLEEEMNDTLCKCFTGRMSRLINCLNGFDDNIIVHISDNEQIGNIIILIKDKLINENNYTIELHKEIVIKELNDRGYNKNVIDEWIDYI